MSNRITERDLEGAIKTLNQVTGNPETHYTGEPPNNVQNPGHYFLGASYGGFALHQVCKSGHGCRNVFGGFIPKRELYNRIHAFIDGACSLS